MAQRPGLVTAMRHEALPRVATGTVVCWLVLSPLVFILLGGTGLLDGQPGAPLAALWRDRRIATVLWNTAAVAVCVAVAATVIGTLAALTVERTRVLGRAGLDKLMLVPIMVSPLVGAVAWVTLARPSTGFVNTGWRWLTGGTAPLFSIYSFGGIALVITLHVAPYVYLNVRSALRLADGAMEEAAVMLGAGAVHVWQRVTLPLALPAILSSALLVFVLALETFSVVGLLGGPARFITLPFNIYLAINLPPGDWNYAALQGVLLLAVTGLLLLGQQRLLGAGGRFASIGGKGMRSTARAGGAAALVMGSLAWAYVTVAAVVPMAALVLQSLLAFTTTRVADMAFTLDNWRTVAASAPFRRAVVNTVLVSAAAAAVAVVLALFVAQLAVFERRRLLGWLAGLPLAFPGIVLGIALVLVYSGTPVYGTAAVLVVAYATQFLPFAASAVSAQMMQLDRGLDEAAKVIGAGFLARLARVSAPIVRPSLVAAAIVTFSRGVRELNVAMFLSTPATIVLPVLIWNFMEQGQFSLAATLSVFQVLLLLACVSLAGLVDRERTAP